VRAGPARLKNKPYSAFPVMVTLPDASPHTTGGAGSEAGAGQLRRWREPPDALVLSSLSLSNSPKGGPYAPYRLTATLSTADATRGSHAT
jgi:hypothetical protein